MKYFSTFIDIFLKFKYNMYGETVVLEYDDEEPEFLQFV